MIIDKTKTMTQGKNICNQLKAVRRSIAEENDIQLETEECTYTGECRGTCPKCESEVRLLENALTERIRLGKMATVAGLALGLAATAQAQAPVANPTDKKPRQEVSIKANCVTLRGLVRDEKTQEEIPFCRIHLVGINKAVDIDTVMNNGIRGDFALQVPKGEYTVYIQHVGYKNHVQQMTINKDTNLGVVHLEQAYVQTYMLGGCEVIPLSMTPAGHEEYFQGVFGTDIIVR